MKNPSSYKAPTYFENVVCYDNRKYFVDMEDIEWRGQVVSSGGGRKFRIKYYGVIHENYKMIIDEAELPIMVYAEEILTKELILLHDGAKHGYNAMFCDKYDSELLNERNDQLQYLKEYGDEDLEVLIYVYNGIDYEDEMEDFINEKGEVTLINGDIITQEDLKRNGYDFMGIDIVNDKGDRYNIVQCELA